MELFLAQSSLIDSFPVNEREEACVACSDKFKDTYELFYKYRVKPTKDLLDNVIDMHLYLGIEPSAKLLYYIEKYLLEGKVFSKLDIYMHLPQYEQIVKLLRPEYYAEVDRSKFRVFTINKYIYNIASQQYTIEDSYEKAYSIWYIDKLIDKGIFINTDDWYYFLEHGPWVCVKYIIDNNMIPIDSNGDTCIRAVLRGNILECVKYVMRTTSIDIIRRYDRYDMSKYLGNVTSIRAKSLVENKDITTLTRLIDLNPAWGSIYLPYIIKMGWMEAFNEIIDKIDVTWTDLFTVMQISRTPMIHEIYNKCLKKHNMYEMMHYAMAHWGFNAFYTLYEICTGDKTLLNLGYSKRLDIIEFCISQGCTVDKDIIFVALQQNASMRILEALLGYYNKVDPDIIERAINADRLDVIQYLKKMGYKIEHRHVALSIHKLNKDMHEWLLREAAIDN